MANMQHLLSFVRTAEHGSFSAAARVLGLTPAGVSKNVARLETDLRIRLFHRTTRHLALTEGGGDETGAPAHAAALTTRTAETRPKARNPVPLPTSHRPASAPFPVCRPRYS